MGHRNQQGLTLFGNKIFTTEHGPKGGDELNLIIPGKHYGWPYFSYGFADKQEQMFIDILTLAFMKNYLLFQPLRLL